MLRVHLLQQWYSLSDPAMEEPLIEVPTMRRLAGIELSSERIPDETTILTFRHLLEKNEPGDQILETVKAHLSAKGMTMRQGTIVDATLIAAQLHLYEDEARVRRRRKYKAGKRDLEMHQTKKGNQWYYRFSGLRLRDESPYRRGQGLRPDPLSCDHRHQCARHHRGQRAVHGDEEVVYGDAGYQGIAKRPEMAGTGVGFRVAMRPGKRRALPETPDGRLQDLIETAKAHVPPKVEHPFRVIKHQFGFQKTRLRGLAKNLCKINLLAALTNLFLASRRLLATA